MLFCKKTKHSYQSQVDSYFPHRFHDNLLYTTIIFFFFFRTKTAPEMLIQFISLKYVISAGIMKQKFNQETR